MAERDAVIVGFARTPFVSVRGKLFSELSAPCLGGIAISAALHKAGIDFDLVEHVIMGYVFSVGCKQNPPKQAGVFAGLEAKNFYADGVSKVCGSGAKAIIDAAQLIQSGRAQVVVAGGMESMSFASKIDLKDMPFLTENMRKFAPKLGGLNPMVVDGLWCAHADQHMIVCGELCAKEHGISLERQNSYAAESFLRALHAQSQGFFEGEIAPVMIEDGEANFVVYEDERPKNFEALRARKNKTILPNGTITLFNAPGLSDGAAALVITSKEFARENNCKVLARIADWTYAAHEPEWFTTAPVTAIEKLTDRAGLGLYPRDFDVLEINAAFSGVVEYALKKLKLNHSRVNMCGDAISLDHPIGASGARIVGTLGRIMRRKNFMHGIAAICLGGGEAIALRLDRAFPESQQNKSSSFLSEVGPPPSP